MEKINTDLPDYIGSYSVTKLIDKINEVGADAEIAWNGWGGSTGHAQRFIGYLNDDLKHKLIANVAGHAVSANAIILPFFHKTIGSLQSDIMLHSVGGGNADNIQHTNNFIYEALAKKIDEVKFKKVTGHELRTVMLATGENRFNVWITGKQAFEVGLYDEVYDLLDTNNSKQNKYFNPKMNELGYEIPDHIIEKYSKKEVKKDKTKTNNIPNDTDMEIKDLTLEILKKENISLYDSIIGIEKDRIAKINKIGESDPEKRNALIESGNELSIEDAVYFTEKKNNVAKVDNLEQNSEKPLIPAKKTVNTTKTAEEIEKENYHLELQEEMGIDKFVKK